MKPDNSKNRQGILLINLGSPDHPTIKDVRSYLKQFLSDPRVIDISAIGRFFLLNLIILPFRPKNSAAAYRKIWTDRGSPLLEYTRSLADKLARFFDSETYSIRWAMRYGNPSIESVMGQFKEEGVEQIFMVPLYPQYSAAATGSVMAEFYRSAAAMWDPPFVEVLPPFFNDPGFIDSWAEIISRSVGENSEDGKKPDHYLFSFHGLPERQILKSDPNGICLTEGCCDRQPVYCYRAHCYQTARLIAEQLGLQEDQYSVSFQSRLGRTPWLKPYTDVMLEDLPGKGKKNLCIISPAFVADCLETLEELNIQGREAFLQAGGERYIFVPSLNDEASWVKALAKLLQKNLPS